jgi:hypothetical protein
MDPILGVLVVVWFVKILAEDAYSAYRGTPNPRVERRVARQRARSRNRAWGALVNYLGDVAEDARDEAAERRRVKRERQRRERELAEAQAEEELAERAELRPHHFVGNGTSPLCAFAYGGDFSFGCGHPKHDPIHIQDVTGDQPVDVDLDDKEETRPSRRIDGQPETETDGRFFDLREFGYTGWIDQDGYAVEGPDFVKSEPVMARPSNVIPFRAPGAATQKENPMTTTTTTAEVTGLDPAIAYADALAEYAGEHGPAGNEGYIGFLTDSKVAGEAITSAHEMQEAFANAQAAAQRHKAELEKQLSVQEAYDSNPDAGDKEFMRNGR